MKRNARSLLFPVALIGLLLSGLGSALAATCTSAVGAVNWNTVGTWSCGRVPAAGDSVVIPNGSTVTLNVDSNAIAGLQVDAGGTLGVVAGTTFDLYLGGNLTNNGTINFFTSTSTNAIYLTGNNLTSTFSGTGTWILDRIDLNGTGAKICTTSCKVELSGSPNLQFFNATPFSALAAGFTFNALGNSTATVTFALAGNQTIATANATFPNLVLSGSGSKTPAAGTLNVVGSLTVSSGPTFAANTNNPAVNLAGNFSNSGTFNSGTGTFTFNGTGAQTLGGTVASTFTNLRINKASGDVTIISASAALSPTVSGTLTLTNGKVITTIGTNDIAIGTAGTISGASAASYVVGNFCKNYVAGANLSYVAGNDFPVGDATSFTPVDITAGTTTTAGSLCVATFTPDHPQVTTPIASTGVAAAQSVNRYWRFTNTGLTVGTALSATFTFVAGDIDPGAVTGSFIVQRYDGTNWNPATIVAANPLNTQVSNITPLAAGSNDFAIGDPISGFNGAVGAFNIFETTTPANAILGRIYTKLAYFNTVPPFNLVPPPPTSPATFNLSVVAVNAGRTGVNAAFAASPITVELLDARDNTGALSAASNCRSTWNSIQSQTLAVAWGGTGRANVTITAPTNAWRDVRVQVTQGGNVGCSSDRFAIRPTGYASVTSTATNSGTSGAPKFNTGQNFTITVSTIDISTNNPMAGYANGAGVTLANPQIIPLIDNTLVVGSPNPGAIGGAFGAAAAGTASGAAFYYSEVGNFGLSANAIYDNVFTAVDQVSDCTADFSNALVGGMYGCKFGSPAIALASGFGRFIPDNFDASLNTAQFATACAAGGFTYTGQTFAYSTAPVITVTARNGTNNGLANATTTNYAGAYMKITNAILTPNTQAARYSRFDALGGGTTPALGTGNVPGAPGVGSDPVIGAFASGVGTLTFSAGTGLTFTRGAMPSSPFSADIALSIDVLDADGVAFAGNPATFGAATAGNGIAFASGKAMRFGRLRLQNAFGPLGNDLPVTLLAEYWNGTAFTTNTLDSCLTLVAGNFALGGYVGGISAANMKPGAPAAGNVSVGGALANGVGTLQLTKPSPAAATPGGVVVCTDLDGGTPTDATCVATTPANLPWLKGNWGNGTTYIDDPRSRATFGLFGAQPRQFIFMREYY
jgi:hypothetical protein